MGATSPILAVDRLCKSFGPVQVLFDIGLTLEPGEVHALIGENGAGKSTLMKILSGFEQPTSGTLTLDGQQVTIPDSEVGENLGIVLIHQEFSLAEQLTVEENVFLGRELHRGPLLDKRAMRRRTAEVMAELEAGIHPDDRVSDLAVSDKQMVEIAKAVSRDARILIMDEPTAVLTPSESSVLFRLIRRLKEQGVTIVYTSHKLDEVKAIADRVTVLRDGRWIATEPVSDLSEDQMAQLMVGRDVSDMFGSKTPAPTGDDIVLEVQSLSVPGRVADASFKLRRGEVLGFAGLIGAGRTELMEGLMGLRPHGHPTIRRHGRPVAIRSPKDAAKAGIVYLTEDRKGRGLLLNMQLRPNVTLLALDRFSRVLIDRKAEEAALDRAIGDFDIRVNNREMLAGNLSGGNQQKLLLAKTMQVEPEIVIIDEPTRGIDIGTKQQIYGFIHRLVEQGKSCIVISSEMQEIIGLCHRVLVMREGRITGELTGAEIEEQEIVRYATGLKGGREDAVAYA